MDRTVYSYQCIWTTYYYTPRSEQTPFTGDDKRM